jgi:hypothetical protein
MRTTLEIDDHVLAVAREMGSALEISLGAALSELARRGIGRGEGTTLETSGIPVFTVGEGSAPITTDMVSKALGEL